MNKDAIYKAIKDTRDAYRKLILEPGLYLRYWMDYGCHSSCNFCKVHGYPGKLSCEECILHGRVCSTDVSRKLCNALGDLVNYILSEHDIEHSDDIKWDDEDIINTIENNANALIEAAIDRYNELINHFRSSGYNYLNINK